MCIKDGQGALLPELKTYSRSIDKKLTIGKEYVVYAICTMNNQLWYLICDDCYCTDYYIEDYKVHNYPVFIPSTFFEIVDNSPSKYWISKMEHDIYSKNKNIVENVGIPALFDIVNFYEKVIDGRDVELVNLFRQYGRLLDSEYKIDSVNKDLTLEVGILSKINRYGV